MNSLTEAIFQASEEWDKSHIGKPYKVWDKAAFIADRIRKPFSQQIKRGDWEDHNFKGKTYCEQRDRKRLCEQGRKVYELMKDGRWRDKRDIAAQTGATEHSISARFSDMKALGMGYTERKYLKNGIYLYRLIVEE